MICKFDYGNIDSILKDVLRKPENYTHGYMQLQGNIEKALEFIPGYIENRKIIRALNTCLAKMHQITKESSEARIKEEFNSIQTYIIENLPRAELGNQLR